MTLSLARRWRRRRDRRRCVACARVTRARGQTCDVCGQERIERTRDKVQLDRLTG